MRAATTLRDAAVEGHNWDEVDPANIDPQADVCVDVDDEGDDDNIATIMIDGVVFPRIASQRIRSMPAAERVQWNADRIKAKTDTLYLAEILDFDMQPEPHFQLFAQFPKMSYPPKPLGDIDPLTKKRLILWSRGTFKTSCVVVYIVQFILSYPDVRICFLTGSDDLAKLQLARVKRLFEVSTERFKYLFPEYVYVSRQNRRTKIWEDCQDAMGNAHLFTVPARTNVTFAEPTMTISTAKKAKAGSHYDVIFADDIVNENNFRSEKMLTRVYDDYVSLLPLLDPQGYLVISGTRYSFGDTYELIQESAKTNPNWKISVRDCWSTGCKFCGCADIWHDKDADIVQPPCIKCGSACPGFKSNGAIGTIFPVATTRRGGTIGFTLKFLADQKLDLGAAAFANQYENRPLSSELQTFTEPLLEQQTIRDARLIPDYFASTSFVVGDLADSDASDMTDLSVLYLCRKFQGQIFVIDAAYGRWGSAALVDNILKMLLRPDGRPSAIYLEKNNGSGHLNDLVIARQIQLGLPRVAITWIKAGNIKGSKSRRIGNCQEALKSKRLWLCAGMSGYQLLVDQLIKWPRVKRDDFCDALGMVVEAPHGAGFETTPQTQSALTWLGKLNQPVEYDGGGANDGSRMCGVD
jgi:hypothetical protein